MNFTIYYHLYSFNCLCINRDFTQLPVRRLSHQTTGRTLGAIRLPIQAFALAFSSVAFTPENTHSAKDEKDMILRIPKVRPSVRYRLYQTVSLADRVDVGRVPAPVRAGFSSGRFQPRTMPRTLQARCDSVGLFGERYSAAE
ncbi:hypothetical protein C8J57DRAFT_347131 [Mycena rebaudengoi]|nr:hypothetical protein C8J57DRAFT_347131 [Mycena rebaudengoi]